MLQLLSYYIYSFGKSEIRKRDVCLYSEPHVYISEDKQIVLFLKHHFRIIGTHEGFYAY